MSIQVCMCTHIYIYMDMYVCGSVCVRGLVAKKEFLSSASLKWSKSVQ